MFSAAVFPFLLSVINICFANPNNNRDLQQQCDCDSTSLLVGAFAPVMETTDGYGNLDFSKIPKYCSLLKNAGIKGVFLASSETISIRRTLSEKKRFIKAWIENCPELVKIVQVRCADYNDTIQLADFCKKTRGVNAVTCEIDKFYEAANSTQAVVQNMEGIAKACYPKQMFISDVTFSCEFIYNLAKIFEEACEKIKNFAGLITDFVNCIEVKSVVKMDNTKSIISTTSFNSVGAYAYCLNGTDTIQTNLFPEWTVDMIQAILSGDVVTGSGIQAKMNTIYGRCLKTTNADLFDRSQKGYDLQVARILMKILNDIDLGKESPPVPQLSRDQINDIYRICEEEGVANYPVDSEDNYKYPYEIKNKNKYGDIRDDDN